MWPNLATTASNAALTAALSAMFTSSARPSGPTVSCAPARLTSSAATLAPSAANRRAIARPMPWPAPVTTATLPFSFMLRLPCSSWVSGDLRGRRGRGGCRACFGHRHRGVFDHVFLPADHLLASKLDQDVAGGNTVLFTGSAGEQQEAAVGAGIANGQCIAVDADRESVV